jgi:hypothetical protein
MLFRVGRTWLWAALALLLVAAGPAVGQDPQPVTIPGTSVSLTPLDGFVPSSEFAGFVDPDSGGSVVVVEFPPEAFAEVYASFNDLAISGAQLARQGIVIEAREPLSSTSLVLSGSQTVAGQRYDKWMSVFGGSRTALITVQAPESAGLSSASVLSMLRTVKIGQPASLEDQITALPFTFEAGPPFRVINVLAGSAVIMTSGPLDVDPSRTQPVVLLASTTSAPVPLELREQAARTQLLATARMADAVVESSRVATFAGFPAIVLSGRFEDGAKRFEQYIGFDPAGVQLRLLAVAPSEEFSSVSPSIETIAASVRTRR